MGGSDFAAQDSEIGQEKIGPNAWMGHCILNIDGWVMSNGAEQAILSEFNKITERREGIGYVRHSYSSVQEPLNSLPIRSLGVAPPY